MANFYSRKYQYNENYFENINTEEKAYWLGFIAADGCISFKPKKHYRLAIILSQKDQKHLEKFKQHINSNQPILSKRRNQFKQCNLTINGQKITSDLISHGVIPNKTKYFRFPKTIPNNLYNHFIRGYFDGDGSFHINRENQVSINICGSHNFIKELMNIFSSLPKINKTKIFFDKNFAVLKFGGNKKVSIIYHYLYQNATIFLGRKKDKVAKILEKKYRTKRLSLINYKKDYVLQRYSDGATITSIAHDLGFRDGRDAIRLFLKRSGVYSS